MHGCYLLDNIMVFQAMLINLDFAIRNSGPLRSVRMWTDESSS
jgi:hypothetical protein